MNVLAVILPFLCLVVLLEKDNLRESFLTSAVVTGLFIALSTEILSLFDLLAYGPLLACWLLYLVSLVAWRYYHGAHAHARNQTGTGAGATLSQKVLLALVIAVVGTAGITAIVAAPNNFDSLTYHLPRMMHWIQNSSVEHYPTHIDRQLWMAPFAEYAIMHLQMLSGGDRFANCVQWFSMVGCAVAGSLIARELQGSLNSQIVSAALSVSIPMGLLQSTSTQNDYVVSFWLACLTYYVLKAKESPAFRNALYVGITLGLAVFTKGTAYLAAIPFMMVYLWHMIGRKFGTIAANIVLISVALLLINGGHYARNFKLYGNPLSPGSGGGITSTRVDVSSVISGVTKNIALQLTSGSQEINKALFALTNTIHNAVDVDVHDPGLTEGRGFSMLPAQVLYAEDYAPNPLHMAAMLLATVILVFRWKDHRRETILCATATILAFVVLSAGIKWNFFISRIFLPVFVISAPCVAVLYDNVKVRSFANCCAAAFLVFSFLVLANNPTRPLLGPKSVFTTERIDQYFMANPRAKPYFTVTATMIKAQPVTNIGILNTDGNMWEYILWVLLKENGMEYRIEHVDVENNSGRIKLEDFSTYFPVRI